MICIKRDVEDENIALSKEKSVPCGNGAILCMHPKLSAINLKNHAVPIWML